MADNNDLFDTWASNNLLKHKCDINAHVKALAQKISISIKKVSKLNAEKSREEQLAVKDHKKRYSLAKSLNTKLLNAHVHNKAFMLLCK